MEFLKVISILVGILKGPVDLDGLSFDIISDSSSALTWCSSKSSYRVFDIYERGKFGTVGMRRERSGPILEKKSLNAFAMVLLSATSISSSKRLEGTVPPNGLS